MIIDFGVLCQRHLCEVKGTVFPLSKGVQSVCCPFFHWISKDLITQYLINKSVGAH